jgi:hypothetical protein
MQVRPDRGVELSTRREWLRAVVVAPMAVTAAERLNVGWDGDSLRFSAPQLHFLAGQPLQRLKGGAPVGFLWQATISVDGFASIFRRVPGRFVVSYDLWEEKFSVMQPGASPRSQSHLSAAAAEAWCVENMVVDVAGIHPEKPFWVRLEVRLEDPRQPADVVDESGINITRLIEFFSRPPGQANPNWTAAAGPLRLASLKRVRGPRGG